MRQKAGLNGTILRNGWSMARSMLEYKAPWRGATLVAVPPAFTSQQCSCCGRIAVENRKTQALFECVQCGHAENADRNAARNILLRAKETIAQRRCALMPVRARLRAARNRVQRLKEVL